jgi:signal peptidase
MGTLLRTSLRVGGWAVLTGLVALLLAAVFVPRAAGAGVYTVLSASMQPTLDPGSLVVVRPTDPENIGVGSVITFQLKSGEPGLVTHRVIAQGFDGQGRPAFLTEGDANNAPDTIWVRPEQIRGAVWYALPYVGYLSPLLPVGVRELLVALVGASLLGYGALMFVFTARERWGVSNA